MKHRARMLIMFIMCVWLAGCVAHQAPPPQARDVMLAKGQAPPTGANVKISELDALTALASGDYVPIVDLDVLTTKRVTIENLFRNLPDGSEAAPGAAFADDQDTGFYRIGSDNIGISLGGSKKYDFGSNVFGIGVTPEAWNVTDSVMRIGGMSSLIVPTTPAAGNSVFLANNLYNNGSYRHIINDEVSGIAQYNGNVYLLGANSGAADSVVSFKSLAEFLLNDSCRFFHSNVLKAWTTAQGLAIATHTPVNAGDTGTANTITWDSDYIYVATAANTWKRVAIATWP